MKRFIIPPLLAALLFLAPLAAPVGATSGGTTDLQPNVDLSSSNVVAVVNGIALKRGDLWPQVHDGTSFASADDNATLVRTKPRSTTAQHTTTYSGAAAQNVTYAVVNLRAARSPLATGTVQVLLYDGSKLLGAGAEHVLGEAYTNFSDEFQNLSVSSSANLRTTVRFTNTNGKGELFYTELWTDVTYQATQTTVSPPTPTTDSPPIAAIVWPADGMTVSGPVVVSGTAGDDAGLSSVTLKIDGGASIDLGTSGTWSYAWDTTGVAAGTHVLTVTATDSAGQTTTRVISLTVQALISSAAPPKGGYFSLKPVGSWSTLPGDTQCAAMVHRSTWEPRPANYKRNHTLVDPAAVKASFAARPLAVDNNYDSRWDTWLLPRVDGQFTGTTDEIFQWAACKWGLPDDLLRGIAVRESTWYQTPTYPSGRCVTNWGCGDMISTPTQDTKTYCDAIAKYGYDYQLDYGQGLCPKTFSIVGIMDWQAPSWGAMPGNQNGTFPFNRNSTAFAVDYLAGNMRGCFEGWQHWLKQSGSGTYAAGDIWGCVGSWYAGDWHSAAADGYISRVQNEMNAYTWLSPDWPSIKPACDAVFGCPGVDPL